MDEFTQTLANGIMLGSIYGLMAVGLALVFGVLQIPQFAFGAHAMIGGYVTWLVVDATGNYWLALGAAAVALLFVGGVVQVVLFDPLRSAPPATLFIAAFGFVMIFEGGAQVVFDPDPRRVREPIEGTFSVAGASITYQRALIVVLTLALFLALNLFLRRTRLGLSIRAVSQNPFGARVVGLNPRRLALLAMCIGSALAGLAGGLLAPVTQVFPTVGEGLILKAFVVVVLAGMGSVNGAVLGGYLLGLVEAFGATYVSLTWGDAFAFLLLLFILIARPEGLFGREVQTWR